MALDHMRLLLLLSASPSQNRMAVSFEYEWHDATGQWYRSYGAELWEFNWAGFMEGRIASINDVPIEKKERRVGTQGDF